MLNSDDEGTEEGKKSGAIENVSKKGEQNSMA